MSEKRTQDDFNKDILKRLVALYGVVCKQQEEIEELKQKVQELKNKDDTL